MDIPIELFLGFTGISIVLAIFGFLRNPQIPATIVMGGMFILVIAVATDNIVFGNRIDNIVATPETFNITSENVDVRIYPYSVTSNSASGDIDSSPTMRSEFVSSTSILLGNTFQCVTIPIQLLGAPSSNLGIVVGFYDNGGVLIQQIGNTLSITQVTSSFQYFDFCLPNGTLHTFITNDRIAIGFNQTTTAGNGINIRIDDTNPFDGTNTYRQSFSGSWVSVTTGDMTFGMYRIDMLPNNVQVAGIGGIYSYEQDNFEFTELPKTLFALIGVMIMLVGGLMVMRD